MWRNARRYLLLLFGLVLVVFLLYRSRNSVSLKMFRWHMVVEAVSGANIWLLILALASIYVCYAIRALRWMQFSRTLGKTHFWNVYSAQLMGFASLFVLGRAGEPVRPVLVARKDSLSMPRMFGVYFLERVFDIAATVVLAGFALLSFERRGLLADEDAVFMSHARSAGLGLLVILAILVAFLIYFKYHGAGWLARKLEHENCGTVGARGLPRCSKGSARACREFVHGATWPRWSLTPRRTGCSLLFRICGSATRLAATWGTSAMRARC